MKNEDRKNKENEERKERYSKRNKEKQGNFCCCNQKIKKWRILVK